MIRRPPRSTLSSSSAASDVYKRQVLLGDADCTYDFRNLGPFMAKFRDGYEYVMGSRFRGYIEPGSMPALHRYFGTPFTTLLLNLCTAADSPIFTAECAESP